MGLLIALTIIGCSKQENEDLPLTKSATVVQAEFLAVIQKQEFKNLVISKFNDLNKGKDDNNGVVIVSRRFSQFFGFSSAEGFIWIYDLDEQFLIKLFSEDRAQFFFRSNDPTVEVYDYEDNLMYSNLCQENKTGHLQVSLISDYDFFDFGPFQIYFIAPPFDSANILKANSKVFDGAQINFETGEISCGEINTEKKLNITSLFRDNSGNHPVINISLK
ncbi:hypothetical protein GCM10023115_50410 [Pontixanthobacter gangjinensis]